VTHADDDAIEVRDNRELRRYEVQVDGALAGILTYRLDEPDAVIILVHTEVDRAFRGRGLADRLARQALDDARARGLRVRPDCPFVTRFISGHQEYQDLVAG
jgi:predicted GNAT family acetyltransferase